MRRDSITRLQVLFIAILLLVLLSYSEKNWEEKSEIKSDFALKSTTGTIR